MVGKEALQTAQAGDVIKIADQPACVHLVWHDKKKGWKRICRPKMLETTFADEEKAWEIVGAGAGSIKKFEAIAARLGLPACKHCIRWSGLQPFDSP